MKPRRINRWNAPKLDYPDYALDPRVGDVWRFPSGSLRVVRETSWGDHIYFAIRRCSWTRAPFTIYYGRELFRMGARVGVRGHVLNRAVDRKMLAAIKSGRRMPGFTCKNACGLP